MEKIKNEYRRWISYFYAYSGEKREENAGFAGIEVRGKQCRIRIKLRGLREGQVYLLAVSSDGRNLQEYGLGMIRGGYGGCEGCFVTRADRMAGSELPWQAFSGIRVVGDLPGQEFRTQWDGRPEAVCKTEIKDVGDGVEAADEVINESADVCDIVAEPDKSDEPDEESDEEPEDEQIYIEAEPETTVCPEPVITWTHLCRTFPHILPFGSGDAWEVLQINLQDIGRLPREHWVLGTNEFIIRSYYEYRHLALIKTEEDIYLGIPGQAKEADRKIAVMFGLKKFRPAEQGGYWLLRINL